MTTATYSPFFEQNPRGAAYLPKLHHARAPHPAVTLCEKQTAGFDRPSSWPENPRDGVRNFWRCGACEERLREPTEAGRAGS